MKAFVIVLLVLLAACKNSNQPTPKTDTLIVHDTIYIPTPGSKKYSNERFKDVTVERIGDHLFILKGRAQVFEATFSWVVEDGHEELKKGFEMTDAGGPQFGNFAFVVNVSKKRANSTLHIILFEVSAKDGSRQYELPILLY
ncbi:MAG: sporulation protein [Segetibacter sp.]|nr:sporulation protein [Segetibacter sp.]